MQGNDTVGKIIGKMGEGMSLHGSKKNYLHNYSK